MAKPAAARAAKPKLPPAYVVMDGVESAATEALIEAVLEGWQAKQDQDAAKARLDSANARLIDLIDGAYPASIVVPGVCRASYSVRQTVKISDPERLEAVLGGRFLDLVKESVSYKAEERLVEMASDGDEPLQPAIAACLTVTESESVTWRAEKP